METQELVKVEKKEVAEIVQNPPPQSVFDMKTFEHAQRVAKMLSSSNLIPKEYQGNIQNTMIALEMAHRIGASPLMVMQNLYVVHGKPGWSSTFIIAAINSCRRFSPLRFVMDGTGDDYGCQCWAYDLATNEKLEGPKVTLKMARAEGWVEKTGSKWKTMPELMFRYRAAAFFGRLYAPDILMGMQTMEEIVDVRPGPAVGPDDLIQTTVEDLALQFDMKKGFLTEDERANCERIIANKETASYPKLSKLLQSK